MNILWIFDQPIDENKGGTERVTTVIQKGLSSLGFTNIDNLMKHKPMHLLFITNNAYVPHVATMLASVFENNKDMEFCVHVMTTDMTEDNHQVLQSFVEGYHHQLDVKKISLDELDINPDVCGKWGVFPSLKLYAADFFPDVDYMLYLDADMICLGSLTPILETDMSDSYIAMVTDEADSIKHKQRLGLPDDAFYGCAGLVWFNVKLWREKRIRQKSMDFYNAPQNRDIIRWGEQDVMNVVCQGHIRELSLEYNMMSIYWLHHHRGVPKKYITTIEQHKRDAVIIHYIDSCKPWFKDCRFPYARYYWHYQTLTPWRGKQYGYSSNYEGLWIYLKNTVKIVLHRLKLKEFDYAYDC